MPPIRLYYRAAPDGAPLTRGDMGDTAGLGALPTTADPRRLAVARLFSSEEELKSRATAAVTWARDLLQELS